MVTPLGNGPRPHPSAGEPLVYMPYSKFSDEDSGKLVSNQTPFNMTRFVDVVHQVIPDASYLHSNSNLVIVYEWLKLQAKIGSVWL